MGAPANSPIGRADLLRAELLGQQRTVERRTAGMRALQRSSTQQLPVSTTAQNRATLLTSSCPPSSIWAQEPPTLGLPVRLAALAKPLPAGKNASRSKISFPTQKKATCYHLLFVRMKAKGKGRGEYADPIHLPSEGAEAAHEADTV